MTRILFLCARNSGRSQMAEAFARARKEKDVEVVSAGLEAGGIHPKTVQVMKEVGLDLSGQTSKSLDDLLPVRFDVVITLCRRAAEQCPVLPGRPETVNWNLEDPASVKGDEAAQLAAFRASRDEIRRLVDDFFQRGYLSALLGARQYEYLVLDNVSDGVIAHDLKRRIFFFNRAAETMTGYSREEVLGRDCHDVFPGNFCGGKCHFCEGRIPAFDFQRQDLEIATKSGERRFVAMTLQLLVDSDGHHLGVLTSFRDLTREQALTKRLGEIEQFSGIIGRDRSMLEIFDLIRELADSNVPVMIQGESGTGKELVAAAIHNEGPRADRLFVPVNCGALPESLLESELFGHVKGAFTGAVRDKKGRFELANGGTIFLDEIGDIPSSMQVKLLRVLQKGEFERVGSEKTVKVNVRVISATHKDLTKEMAAGRFREDLFYRLSVVPVRLPALRERRNDIPLLAENLLDRMLKENGREKIAIAPEAISVMMSYDWPGNVRELQNWLQFALVKSRGRMILPEHLPPAVAGVSVAGAISGPLKIKRRRRRKLDIESFRAAMQQVKQNKVEAAKLLGVSRATLYRFLSDMGLE